MSTRIEESIDVHSPAAAISVIADAVELSRQQIKRAMGNGCVWLEDKHGTRRLRRAKRSVNKGDRLHIYHDDEIQQQLPAEATLVADEGKYSIWSKPAGMYSQGSKWGDHCTLYRWAETHLEPQRPAYLVHRLDRAASGLMILAHDKKTTTAFLRMFGSRTIEKRYAAVVMGDTGALPDTIDSPIDDKASLTHIIERHHDAENNRTELIVQIETGRKHQIRRHLAESGYPIIGDRLYGSDSLDDDLRLTSVKLAFDCPLTGEPKSWFLAEES